MRALTDNEVHEVSGGIIPFVMAIVAIDIALNVATLGWHYVAFSNSRANRKAEN